MIKLPCKATFRIVDYEDDYSLIIVIDKRLHFSKIENNFTEDDEVIAERLSITLKNVSIWPIIKELERYARENNIIEEITK